MSDDSPPRTDASARRPDRGPRDVASSLDEGESRFQALFRDAPVGIFSALSSGRIVSLNPEMARILGHATPEEALGDPDGEDGEAAGLSIQPDRREQYLETLRENGSVEDFECRIRTADGGALWLSLNAWISLWLEDGEFVVSGFATDIDDRRRAELAIRRLGDMAVDLISVADLETARFLEVNPAFERVLGHPREEFLRRPFLDFVHPDDRDATLAVLERKLRQGETVVSFENRYRCRDGSYRILEWTSHPVPAEGVTYAIAHDVTERREVERRLREHEAFTKAVLDHLPVGIAVNPLDPEVEFSYMNDNFPRFYRTTREALAEPGAFWEAVYEDPEFRARMKARIVEDCFDGDPERMYWPDVPITRKGEPTRYVTARNTPVPEKNLLISTVWDVTDRVRAEEQRAHLESQLRQAQKLEAVGRLAGGVAHDFNNMLQAILGYTDILLHELGDDTPHRPPLVEIRKAARRSAELTRQLLAFARKQPIAPRVLDLNDTVGGMLRMLERLIGEDIELSWKPGPSIPPVRVDPAQIDQILANLVVNARDAIPGVGRITIETTRDETTNADGTVRRRTVLEVIDTGEGMSPEVRARAFEPFFTTKPTDKGTGLGLATVFGIVTQNEGSIDLESEPGRGTTVRITLPAVEDEPASDPVLAGETRASTGTETVLLVEDEEALLDLNRRVLERLGYVVLAARGPEEALGLAATHDGEIHALLTDVVMPRMSGRDLWRRLRAARPETVCLYMTGYPADVIAPHGVIDAEVEVLQKPFDARALARKLREVLDRG